MGGFKPTEIEFLGWLSYNAAAINNSRNPVKAAHTILAKCEDPDSKMYKMLMLFKLKKNESVKPTEVAEHGVADAVFEDLKWDERKAITIGMLSSNGDDYTKGGISDGMDSINSESLENEGEELQDVGEDYE